MFTVKKVVETIISNVGEGTIKINSNPNQLYESNVLSLDITKAINQLKWEPKLDFFEMIKLTSDEYQVHDLQIEEIYQQRLDHINHYSSL